jgi:hypothetical protein
VDTIPTSANTEDHVSMGPAAARQARQIAVNVERILALELLAAAQAIDFRREVLGPDARLGQGTAPAYALIRQRVPFLEQDAVMYPHIEAVWELVGSGELTRAVRAGCQRAFNRSPRGRRSSAVTNTSAAWLRGKRCVINGSTSTRPSRINSRAVGKSSPTYISVPTSSSSLS